MTQGGTCDSRNPPAETRPQCTAQTSQVYAVACKGLRIKLNTDNPVRVPDGIGITGSGDPFQFRLDGMGNLSQFIGAH